MSPLVISLISLLLRSADALYVEDVYVGCYADIAYESPDEKHDLPDTVISYTKANVIIPCINSCRNKGFYYAGARVVACYCGNSYGKFGKVSDDQCVHADCGGSRCGGETQNAIYRVCPFGTFNTGCSQICHCTNKGETCAPLTGFCPDGGCEYGWVTQSCSIRDKCIDEFGCQNGGTCKPDRFKINYMCECHPQFAGLHCERQCNFGYYGDDCEKICRCRETPCNIKTGECRSACQPAFYGPRCDQYDPCSTNPCQNGAACFIIEDQYHCKCSNGFLGYNCQFDTSASGSKNRFVILPHGLRLKQILDLSEYHVKRQARGNGWSNKYEYIGCFRDQDHIRDLDSHLWIDENMGPGACARHCLRKGFTFAGIQDGMDCRCGNRFGKYGIVPNAECDIVCANEPLQKCGAEDMNSIYSVCPAGRYEPTCKPTCNCLADKHCDLMTGVCPNRLCKQGWTGMTCNEGIVYKWQFPTSTLVKSLGIYVIIGTALTIWASYQSMKIFRKRSKIETLAMEQEYTDVTI